MQKTYSTKQLKDLIIKIHKRNGNKIKFMVNFIFMINTQNSKMRYNSSIIDKNEIESINNWNKLKKKILGTDGKYQYTIPLLWDKKHITLLIVKNKKVYHMDSGYNPKHAVIYDLYLNGLANSLKSKFIRTSELEVEGAQGNANLCFTYMLEYYDRLIKKAGAARLPSLKRIERSKLDDFMKSLGSGHGSKDVRHHKSDK